MVHVRISPQHAEGGVQTIISLMHVESGGTYNEISINTLVHPRQMFQRIPQTSWEMTTDISHDLTMRKK
jgi:hypothetical protein